MDDTTESNNVSINNIEENKPFLIEKLDKKLKNRKWTSNDDKKLIALVESIKKENKDEPINWNDIAYYFTNKTSRQCYLRYRQNSKVYKKGQWSKSETERLNELVKLHGTNWCKLSSFFQTRSEKQIRDHYLFYISNKVKFSAEEDKKINELYQLFGTKFSLIAKQMPGRTTVEIKNRWYSTIKKTLKTVKLEDNSQVISPPSDLNSGLHNSILQNSALQNSSLQNSSLQNNSSLKTSSLQYSSLQNNSLKMSSLLYSSLQNASLQNSNFNVNVQKEVSTNSIKKVETFNEFNIDDNDDFSETFQGIFNYLIIDQICFPKDDTNKESFYQNFEDHAFLLNLERNMISGNIIDYLKTSQSN